MSNYSKVVVLILLVFSANRELFSESQKLDSYSKHIIANHNAINNEYLINNQNDNKLSDSQYIRCLIKVSGNAIEPIIGDLDGNILVKSGDIWGIEIPLSKIGELIKHNDLLKLSISQTHTLNNYESKIDTKVDKLHIGETGNILKGKDVIVGICDTGIDINHPDFKNENGTRIKYIWDMSDKSGVKHPLGYNWGREYNSSEINNGTCKQKDVFGHGTHVSGIAIGNGNGNIKYSGMAPEADIIMVKVSYQEDAKAMADDVDVIAAIDWIFKKADELGKPAVVNLSFGHVFGPHDGTSLLSEGISNLSAPGKIIVASAGNTSDMQLHTGRDFVAGEYYETIIVPVASICNNFPKLCPDDDDFFLTGCDLWYSANSIDSIFVSVYDYNPGSNNITLLKTVGFGKNDVFKNEAISDNNEIYGYIDIDFTNNNLPENNSGNSLVLIHNKSNLSVPVDRMIWSVIVKTNRAGRLDTWSVIPTRKDDEVDIIGSFGKQLFADANMSVASPADGKKVISVGSYVTLNKVTFDDGFEFDYGTTIFEVSDFSSKGPTRDGRIVPTVLAPGQTVVSALSGDRESNSTISSFYTNMSGTSMSSPAVAGIIALMLQIKPNLTFDEIVDILKFTSRYDKFTGKLPNITSGYGKIDALSAIQRLIHTRIDEIIGDGNSYYCYPNPAEDYIEITQPSEGSEIEICNLLGECVLSTSVNFVGTSASGGQVRLNISHLPVGVYFIRIGEQVSIFVKQ